MHQRRIDLAVLEDHQLHAWLDRLNGLTRAVPETADDSVPLEVVWSQISDIRAELEIRSRGDSPPF